MRHKAREAGASEHPRKRMGSREVLASPVSGPFSTKAFIFVVEDLIERAERTTIGISVSDGVIGKGSRVMSYSDFYRSGAGLSDALVLRASRMFPFHMQELQASLEAYRRANPKSTVILCVFDHVIDKQVTAFAQSGLVDSVEYNPIDDFALLRRAAAAAERPVPSQ